MEPFGGAYGIYFSLDLTQFPNTKFIYNDINPLNSNLFQSLKSDSFIEKVKKTQVSKELFLNSYNLLDSEDLDEKALSWLIILCSGDSKDLMNQKYQNN